MVISGLKQVSDLAGFMLYSTSLDQMRDKDSGSIMMEYWLEVMLDFHHQYTTDHILKEMAGLLLVDFAPDRITSIPH